ncbi:MAG TPA: Wzz/FepE/Etk N-terminal domain-containing protein [Roseiflexaceae bacterium]|nr:Wzz/FepE/Etk N-terminal domain-containing protein [Roseiflexaceae bacterium]
MEIYHYFTIVRRRWPIVVVLPLLAGLLALAAALLQPPAYAASARVLVHRATAIEARAADPTVRVDDTVTDDLPAILRGEQLAREVSEELARRGHTLEPAAVQASLSGEIDNRSVLLSARAGDPDTALAVLQTTIDLLRANGLRYWGARTEPQESGITLALLESPSATQLNGTRAVALSVGLRTLAGLGAGVGLAFLLHYLDGLRAAHGATRPASAERRPQQEV